MRAGTSTTLLGHIHRAIHVESAKGVSDSELLARYANNRDEAAFATLLQRHGRLVWGVCRRQLSAEQDAEDAFQATFLDTRPPRRRGPQGGRGGQLALRRRLPRRRPDGPAYTATTGTGAIGRRSRVRRAFGRVRLARTPDDPGRGSPPPSRQVSRPVRRLLPGRPHAIRSRTRPRRRRGNGFESNRPRPPASATAVGAARSVVVRGACGYAVQTDAIAAACPRILMRPGTRGRSATPATLVRRARAGERRRGGRGVAEPAGRGGITVAGNRRCRRGRGPARHVRCDRAPGTRPAGRCRGGREREADAACRGAVARFGTLPIASRPIPTLP